MHFVQISTADDCACIAAAQVVDFYMNDTRQAERAAIADLSSKDDNASMELLSGYIREALR